MMWYWGNNGVDWWGWLLMALGMVVFWGFVIWAVWTFATSMTRRPDGRSGPGDPKRILDERLARGEIDPEEYRRLRDLIGGHDTHAGNGQTPVGAGDRR